MLHNWYSNYSNSWVQIFAKWKHIPKLWNLRFSWVEHWTTMCYLMVIVKRIWVLQWSYNEVLGTMKITLLYQVSHYIRAKKQRNIKSWDQQNYLVIRGFCYIRPLYNEVPLYYYFSPFEVKRPKRAKWCTICTLKILWQNKKYIYCTT